MEKFFVRGGVPLHGEVVLSGSKNACLAILAGALLSPEEVTVTNVPPIDDVHTMLAVLRALGAAVHFDEGRGVVRVCAREITSPSAPYELVKKMRASFYVSGGLLARRGEAHVPLPGGCVIGNRPVDFHINAFRRMGAAVRVEHGDMHARCERLHGVDIFLDPKWCSVGATVNVMMAATLAEGKTTIENAGRDPEIVDFASFLNRMGAKVIGAGTSTITVEGVSGLTGCRHEVISDRIEAGTYLFAGAITGGDVTVCPLNPSHLSLVTAKLEEAGVEVTRGRDWLRAAASRRPEAVDIATAPFPGFPTDLQPPLVALMSLARGKSIVEERIYEGRLNYVDELRRMGADITIIGQTAVVNGKASLTGAPVEAPDLRAGAALILAGVAAEGETEISGVHFIDRGYHRVETKLSALGAQILRCDESAETSATRLRVA